MIMIKNVVELKDLFYVKRILWQIWNLVCKTKYFSLNIIRNEIIESLIHRLLNIKLIDSITNNCLLILIIYWNIFLTEK